MNYYQRHIGDYIRNTAHLSLLEHGVYTRLLDVYYSREGPLPADQVFRLIGARTKEEREAAKNVLEEFFTLSAAGQWAHARCDQELSKHHDFISKQAAKGKASGEARRANRDQAAVEQRLNSGSPPVQPDQNRRATEHEPPNSHYPIPGSQSPDTSPPPLALQVETGVSTQPKVRTTGQFIPQDFELTEERRRVAVAERVPNVDREFQRFTDYWRAASGANARKRDWDGTWRNWCRKAADMGGRPMGGAARPTIDERLAKLRE